MSIDKQILIISQAFNKPYEFTEEMLLKHDVTLPLPRYRQAHDGLDAFYSDMTAEYNDQPSLTKQEFTRDTDPNFIIDRLRRGQDVSAFMSQREPQYGDFTQVPASYHEALNVVKEATYSFMQLDPELRSKFENNPAKFVDFVSDPKNAEALIEMGLAMPKPAEATPPAAAPSPAPAAKENGGGEGA